MKAFVIVLIVFAALFVLLPLLLLAPRLPGKKKKAPFYGRNFAHRGLYDNDEGIPENSLAAFGRAADAGYGIELDVRLTRDGETVVFHDDTLERICGVASRVDELDYADIKKLGLCGTDERIPLFSDVLKLIDRRVPIIVEIKNGRRNNELCSKTLAVLNEYGGETCIESFNPLIVAWFRRHAPQVFRGQLSQPPEFYKSEGISKTTGFLLGNLFLNVLARPHFIAYRIGKKPITVRFAEALGAVRIAWTSHDEDNEKAFDAVIFEHYLPGRYFKRFNKAGESRDCTAETSERQKKTFTD